MSTWSDTPALREYIEETAKNLRTATKTNKFCRSVLSSSSSSMRNNNTLAKRKKINKNKENLNVDSHDSQEYRLPTPQASTRAILISHHEMDDDGNESEEIGTVSQVLHTGEKRSDIAKSTKDDMNTLLNENKALQEKVLSLENELLFERAPLFVPLDFDSTFIFCRLFFRVNFSSIYCVQTESVLQTSRHRTNDKRNKTRHLQMK